MTRARAGALWCCLLAAACSAPALAPQAEVPAASDTSLTADAPNPTAGQPSPAPAAVAAAPVAAPAPETSASSGQPEPMTAVPFEQVLPVPVRSLALGEGGRVAALAEQPWLFEGGRWQEVALPPSMRIPASPDSEVRIYFGRDHRPRIMGWQRQGESKIQVYLRLHKGAWKRERGEIGRLIGAPAAPLFGVLGYEDPEVVCKPGDICLIKQRSGWSDFPAPAGELPTVIMSGGAVWAIDEGRLRRLGAKGWLEVAMPVPWSGRPTDLWSDGEVVWASEAKGELHRWDGADWTTESAPLTGPRGLWGASARDLWLASDGGAAHYDGMSWRPVAGPRGPLAVVVGRDGELWLGGDSGLWRGKR